MRINATSRQARSACQRERIVAVVLGRAPHHHQECGLQQRLALVERDHFAIGALKQHVVEPDAGAALRLDVVGPFIHHAETHVFQDRNALGERQRPREGPDLQAGRTLVFFLAVEKVDTQRPLFGQSFNDANVAGGNCRRIGFLETIGECVPVTAEQRARLVR